MINFLICLIISVFLAYGLAILLVEKGKDWPIRPWRIRLQLLLHKIHWKLPQMLYCTVCVSFWATLFSDLTVYNIASLFGCFYFFWPWSGIITAAITWTIIEHLNAIDLNKMDNDSTVNNKK